MTERNRAKEPLQSLAQFPAENPNPVLRIAPDGQVLYANAAAAAVLIDQGWRRDRPAPSVFRETAGAVWQSGTRRLVDVRCRDARIFSFDCIVGAAKEYVGLYGHDVTDARRTEEGLRRSEAEFRAFFDTAAVGTAQLDLEGRLVQINDRYCEITGYTREELLGRSPVTLSLPGERDRDRDEIMRFVRGELAVYDVEKRCVRKDGSTIWVHVTGSVLRDPTGRPFRAAAVIQDITERKRAEQALRERELEQRRQREFLERLVNRAPIAIAVVEGMDLRFTLVNPTYQTIVGRDVAMIGRPYREVFPDAAARGTEERLRDVLRTGEPRPVRDFQRHISGRTDVTWWEGEILPLPGVSGEPGSLLLLSWEISERRHAEDALRRSEQMLAEAGEIGQLGAWWIEITDPENLDANPLHWSDLVYRIFGHEPGDIGVTRELFYEHVHPEDRDRVAASLARALAEKKPYSIEHRIIRPDGAERVVLERAQASYDDQGRLRRIVGAVQDITERKGIEEALRRATAAAEDASRAKDHFLAVLSHELRTPLTPVLTGVLLLQKDQTLSERARGYLDIVCRNVELEARLIDDLLDVTRIVRGKLELDKRRIELCTVIHRAVEVCRPDIEARRLHFGVDLGPRPYLVDADAARLQQVFWNLLKNAIKFTPHAGCVGIRCRPDGGHVVVEVSDSGIGIEPSALGRIFDAFAQAERSITQHFGGLGLGLAISKALVEAHGGTIEAHSEGRDRGATFTVRLPMISVHTRDVTESGTVPPAPSGEGQRHGLRILLVEDHGDTAEMVRLVLEGAGHEVQTAGDVATALELATQAQFDLLVSDLGLPDRSGLDLMRELYSRGRAVPGIAVSGYGQEQDIERSRAAGFGLHLVKPVDPARLLDALDRVARGAQVL